MYLQWLGTIDKEGRPVNMFAACARDKLVLLGNSPQDLQWAERDMTKYLAAQTLLQMKD